MSNTLDEIKRQAEEAAVTVEQASRIALQIPKIKWFEPASLRMETLDMLQMPYVIVAYYGVMEMKTVEGAISIPSKHHRVLVATTPPGLRADLFKIMLDILQRTALNLGAPDSEGGIGWHPSEATKLQAKRLRDGIKETNTPCQWSLYWMEDGTPWPDGKFG